MNKIKCKTGSFDVLDAIYELELENSRDHSNSHNVHSAELTKTVRSSGVIPNAVSTESGLKANGAWN